MINKSWAEYCDFGHHCFDFATTCTTIALVRWIYRTKWKWIEFWPCDRSIWLLPKLKAIGLEFCRILYGAHVESSDFKSWNPLVCTNYPFCKQKIIHDLNVAKAHFSSSVEFAFSMRKLWSGPFYRVCDIVHSMSLIKPSFAPNMASF